MVQPRTLVFQVLSVITSKPSQKGGLVLTEHSQHTVTSVRLSGPKGQCQAGPQLDLHLPRLARLGWFGEKGCSIPM